MTTGIRSEDVSPFTLVALRRIGLALGMIGGLPSGTAAQLAEPESHDLGTVVFPVSCSPSSRAEFNRAVALLHHMTYPRARDAFRQVAAAEPQCAMAQWGIAMTLFQPLWPTRPSPEALRQGWEAVRKARSLGPATDRERRFIGTAEAFFLEPDSPDYWLRIRRWKEAAQAVYDAYPEDADAGAFYALALLATAPSDTSTRANADRAAAILLQVYQRNPDHPGAMHYLIHANDMPGRERELPGITRKYEASAPRNPHALHMPTHIYVRRGDWDGAIRGNLRAADAALETPAGEHGELVWDEFPHAIEYLVYAYLQKGMDEEAAAQVQRLLGTPRVEPTFKTAFHLSSVQARSALERRAWREAAALAVREPATIDWDRFGWPEAIARFARGLGAAHLGDLAEARAADVRLEQLEGSIRKAGEELFARNIGMLRLELTAWIAHVGQDPQTGVRLMREAADLEASTPKHAVTPGPTLPADELLGDMLSEQRRPAEALAAYRAALARYPGRFNALLGAARSAKALGDASASRTYYRKLLDAAGTAGRRPALREAKLGAAGSAGTPSR